MENITINYKGVDYVTIKCINTTKRLGIGRCPLCIARYNINLCKVLNANCSENTVFVTNKKDKQLYTGF